MAKVFLICFSPFNPKVRSLPHSSPPKPNYEQLFGSLIQDLQKSLEEESIPIKWCSDAMLLSKTMHTQFLSSFSKRASEVSGPWERALMVDHYLKESLDLLDLCNLLKSAISGFDRQRLTADFAVHVSTTPLKRFSALKEEMEMFKSVVDDVFDEVIQGRKKVLLLIASDGVI